MLLSRESPLLVLIKSGTSHPERGSVKAELTSNHKVLGAVITLGEDEPRLD